MSARKYQISYSAAAQVALLPREEKAALIKLFSSHEIDRLATTEAMSDGRFVSRLGSKRVLWRRSAQKKREIISVVDQSFAKSG